MALRGEAWSSLSAFCLSRSFPRFFIYSQIKEYGALVFAATMNVRQVVSILVSYAAWMNSIFLILKFRVLSLTFG